MRGQTLMAVATALVLAACTGSGGTQNTASNPSDPSTLNGQGIVLASALQPFDDCDALLDYFKTQALEVVGPYGLGGGPMYYGDDVAATDGDMAGAESAAGAAPAQDARSAAPVAGVDYSGTNVQTEGVDEPDTVKTNGEIVVAIARGKLQIVDLDRPGRVLSTLKLDGWSHELLLDGDRLLVVGQQDSSSPGPVPLPVEGDVAVDRVGAPYPGYYAPVSVLTSVDISDPADPQVTATLTLDGQYTSARMTDGVARIVMTSQPTGLVFTYPEGGGLRAERDAEKANRKIIEESTIDNWLPYYVLEGEGGGEDEGTLLECADVSHPEDFSGLGLLSVLSVDVGGTLTPDGGVAIVASGETVYASPETLYVTTNRWYDPLLIESGEVDVAPDDYTTEIHAFDITDPHAARYTASGAVKGHLLNQFSLDEYDGTLRVATTNGAPWGGGPRSQSFVTTMRRDGDTLKRIGQVGDLGRDEQIYAVRFLGDVGYVVTFRQTDPLYTIDLSDPRDPKVTGELKILGYSAYLHPVSDELLLGVGQDANAEGQTKGLQLSLFNVSDPAAPRRVAQATIPGGYSDAEYDHRAFLYWAPKDLTVVPVQSYDYNERTGVEHYDINATAFKVRRGDIHEAGVVRHTQRDDPNAWEGTIHRSMVVGDTLVTVSELGLKVSDIDDFSDLGFARFQ